MAAQAQQPSLLPWALLLLICVWWLQEPQHVLARGLIADRVINQEDSLSSASLDQHSSHVSGPLGEWYSYDLLPVSAVLGPLYAFGACVVPFFSSIPDFFSPLAFDGLGIRYGMTAC